MRSPISRPVWFVLFVFYWHVPPSVPLAVCPFSVFMRVGVPSPGWSVLFYFVLFFYWHVSPSVNAGQEEGGRNESRRGCR